MRHTIGKATSPITSINTSQASNGSRLVSESRAKRLLQGPGDGAVKTVNGQDHIVGLIEGIGQLRRLLCRFVVVQVQGRVAVTVRRADSFDLQRQLIVPVLFG